MGTEFKKTEKLFNTEDKFIKKLEVSLMYDFGNFDDLVSFYKDHIEKDNYKIINDAHVEIRNSFYKTDKFNIYLNERIKKYLLPLSNNYEKIGKQFEEKYNIDIYEIINIDIYGIINVDSLDTENKKIYELYMCIMDIDHYIKLTALEMLYNDAITNMNKDVNLQNDKTPSTINNDDKKIKIAKEIDNLINSMDINKQWEKVFFEKTDYENYKDILVNFFNDTNSNIPKIEIKIRPNSKSSIIGIFKSLHDKYTSFAGHMKDDKNLMELVKILSLFKNDSDDDIIKRIQSNAIKP